MSIIDTLASAFKGSSDSRLPLAQGFISPWASAIDRGGAPRMFDYTIAINSGFVSNPIAQRAVRIIAESVGRAPISQSDDRLQAFVKIVLGNDGWPCAFEYRVGSQVMTLPIEDENGWPNCIHIRSLHPTDDHYGAGALAAADQPIAVHNAAVSWNRALLENAARPSGALVYEDDSGAGLTSEQFDRLKAELEAAFSGQGNAGRPMLLDGGLKWQSMALSPADMDFAELKSSAARDIALAFGVPPMLLGIPGDNTYSNYREANRALWRLTLLPLADKLLGALCEGLAPWYPQAKLAVDLDRVPALSEDRERLWKQLSDADFLSEDEKRAMLGFEPRGEMQ
jgi:HK97 family phage portal protein